MVQILNSRSKLVSDRVLRRSETRRLEILRAAARVFRRRGVAATGMREIAQEADLSPGNLYYYFSGKDELLLFCQERTLEHMLAAVSAARATPASSAEQLRSVLRAHVHAMLDELEGATAHLEVDALPEGMRAPIIEKRDRYERAVRQLVARGVETRELAPCDPTLVTRAVLGALNGTAQWFRKDGSASLDAVCAAYADYLLRGLLA